MDERRKAVAQVAGTWSGALKVGEGSIRIVLVIRQSDDGGLAAELSIPDQGLSGIEADKVVVEGKRLSVGLAKIGSELDGAVDSEGERIEGTWVQMGARIPLVLTKGANVEAPKRPQEPMRPLPYEEVEVEFDNPGAGIRLFGTLTMPKGRGRHSAAVLIHGSGPHDRDETVFGHRPFLVLADHLTRSGIAVLRFDARGVGKSSGEREQATSEDFATDVESAVAFLRRHERIDPDRISLIGHSEGGIIAPMVASKDKRIAFIVLLGGSGMKGEDLLHLQSELVLRSSGADEQMVSANDRLQRRLFRSLREGRSEAEIEDDFMKAVSEEMPKEEMEKLRSAGLTDEHFRQQARMLALPWMRFFLAYDPVPTLEKVRCPVLAMLGELDMQVPPIGNAEPLRKALEKGDRRSKVVVLPKLNHLFQEARTGSPNEYASIEQTMSPQALGTISEWIRTVLK
jgi:pimeloyl-ACP methyl ester carboxylesterase